ncbi:MAG: double zinc ribbon domain-containing protein [Clostridia bacterium]|nr:double zinc ribbon domain-containing protein [Clostridia bacterium]
MNLLKLIQEKISRYDDTHNYTCDNCGKEVFDGRRLCGDCKAELPYNNQKICPFCGRRVREDGVCLDCKQKPLETQKARSLWLHEGDAAKLVRHFKTGEKYLFRLFVEELTPLVLKEFGDADAITYVPMTKNALKKRGYNQTLLIAEGLHRSTGKELLSVAEKDETADQRELTREKREENMKEAFKVTDKKAVKGRRILIVDDTLTTGATASAFAAVLKKAGAAAVYLVTATSVEKKNPYGIK